MTKRFEERFAELETEGELLQQNRGIRYSDFYGRNEEYIEAGPLETWRVKSAHLIRTCCGSDSVHAAEFQKAGETKAYTSDITRLRRLLSVFAAAKSDYEAGLLTRLRELVQAEVFGDELEQAEDLLKSGYYVAAAVIAGIVLETTLRSMCATYKLETGKADKMNADLTKNGAYNALTQKRITALLGIRNSAAHGKVDEFTHEDVARMIPDISSFLAKHLS